MPPFRCSNLFKCVKCQGCSKPLVCKSNLLKLRAYFAGGGGDDVGTVALLPVMGFGLGGIAAAGWHTRIGTVAVGSLFAVLQSLGIIGKGTGHLTSIDTALDLLTSIAGKIGWCSGCKNDKECNVVARIDDASMKWKKSIEPKQLMNK